MGKSVVIFCPLESPEEKKNATALEKELGVTVFCFLLNSKKVRFAWGLITGKSLSQSNFLSQELLNKLTDYVKNNSVKTIIASASSIWPYLCVVKKSTSRPIQYFVDLMDVDSDKWSQYAKSSIFPLSWLYKRESRLVRELEVNISEDSDACYLIAKTEVELFKKSVDQRSRIKVLGNGIDTKLFYPSENKSNSNQKVLLFTGVMDYKPNVDAVKWFVKNCWPTLKQLHSKLILIIAGMNPNSTVLELGRLDSVEVTGTVDEILPYFHKATVFIAPFQIARGVQNKVLQALSCGLPVVTTTMGAEGINATPNEHFIIADNVQDFTNQVHQLLMQPELCCRLGEAAVSLIQNEYSWQGQLRPLINDLTEVC